VSSTVIKRTISGQIDARKLPPVDADTPDEIGRATEAHSAARAAYAGTASRLRQLEQGRKDAEARDVRALADAKQAGRKDPGPKHVQEYEHELAEAKRHVDADQRIVDDKLDALDAAFDEHGDQWDEVVAEREAAEYGRYLEAVRNVLSIAQEVSRCHAVRVFLRGGSYKVPQPTVLIGDERVQLTDLLAQLDDLNGRPPVPQSVHEQIGMNAKFADRVFRHGRGD
jgi:hypothetical protein